jgi:RsiW-degrading membrane proteinase PrsW (M82 family)
MVDASLTLGIIPAILWLAFFLAEDWERPEPKRLIFLVFLAGGLSTVIAAAAEIYIQNIFPAATMGRSTPTLFAFAFIEELVKFVIVYLLVKKSTYFDEKVDAMIYMITAALGFAAIENVLNLVGADIVIEITLVRGIGATLLHALCSGILGFYWIRGRVLEGFIGATFLHGAFNYLILRLPGIEIYASILLLFAAIIVFHDFEVLKKIDAQTKWQKIVKRLPFRP